MPKQKEQIKKTPVFTADTEEAKTLRAALLGRGSFSFVLFVVFIILCAAILLYQAPRVITYLDSGILLPKGEFRLFLAGDTAITKVVGESGDQSDEVMTANVETNDDSFIGSRDTSIMHIVVFSDFECPFSAELESTLRNFVLDNPNAVFVQFRDFPIESLHPDSTIAAIAANCAQDSGKFWQYHDILFERQGTFTRENLIAYADEAGISRASFTQCLDSQKYLPEIQVDYKEGYDAGVRGTPTLFVNNVRLPGAVSRDILDGLLDELRTTQKAISDTIDENNTAENKNTK